MLYQFFKISLLTLLLVNIGCKQDKFVNQNVSIHQKNKKLNNTIITTLDNKEYTLKLETLIINDTLDVIDYKENEYSSPIIIFQELVFYYKGKLIKDYKLPLININKKTITGKVIRIIETPIYEICVYNNFYIINGTYYDYCNGVECPEFIGIYDFNGNIIYEYLTSEKIKTPLKDILDKYKIDINNKNDCVNISLYEVTAPSSSKP